MQSKKLHLYLKRTTHKFSQRIDIKVLFVLLSACIIFSSCFHKKTTPIKRDEKRHLSLKEETNQNPLKTLLGYLRLTESDLKIDPYITDEDYFRLDKVNVLLDNPLKIEPYSGYLSKSIKESKVSLKKMLSLAIKELEINIESKNIQDLSSIDENNQFKDVLLNIPEDARDELLKFLSIACLAQTKLNEAFSPLSHSEIGFLKTYFSEMIIKDKIEFIEEIQVPAKSPSIREEQYVKETSFYLASKINREQLYEASLMVAGALDHLLKNSEILKTISMNNKVKEDNELGGDIILCEDTPLGKVIIGGKEPTYYRNTNAFLIIDLGGDDEYHNISPDLDSSPFSSAIIIDLEGNDLYNSREKYSLACGSFGLSFLIDCSGDDRYLSQDFSQGCGFFGVGVLYDKEGDDRYLADIMGQGAAAFGAGILCDLKGNDSYHGNLLNQGMGFVGGMGLLIESQGNDSFFSGGKYPDFREPDVAFDSFSQGFGYGYRNFGSGGIGVLWDDEGNDHYSSSYFSQGSSYWLAIGLLIDNGGNDIYHARRYTQGTGTHLTVGALIDRLGDDCYTSMGVSQGCGYDFSQGLLLDNEGDDIYSAEWFAQGTSGSSGTGILIDQMGNDSYLCGSFNSQGSGQYSTKMESGNIGLLIDLEGKDRYSVKGEDDCLWHQGKYGGGIDSSKSTWDKNIASWSDGELTSDKETISPSIKPPVLEEKELLPELESSLGNEDYRQMVIKKFSEKGPSIIPRLIDYLDIKDDLLKQTIMDIVKEMGKVAAPALIKTLEKNNLENSLTSSILYMSGDMEDEQSQDTFIYYLNADNSKIRSMAMRGLSKLAPAPLLVDILPYAKDENPSVRKYLAMALKEYEGSEAIKVLTNFLADDDFNVRFAAFESLKGNGAKAKKRLLNLIKHQDRYPQHAIDLARDLLEECEVRN